MLTAGIHELAHDISFTIFVGAMLNAVIGCLRGPKAETLFMTGCENHELGTHFLGCFYPLVHIQFRRVKS